MMTSVKLGLSCLVSALAYGNQTQDKIPSPVFLQSNGAQDLQVMSSFAQDVVQNAEEVLGAKTRTPDYIRLACADKTKEEGKVDADLNFIQSIKMDPNADGCCVELAKAVKFMAGEDAIFQNDEKDDAVAFIVVSAGEDSTLSKRELEMLNKGFDLADTSPKDGTLNAKERNAIISAWQKALSLGKGELAQGGAPTLQALGTLQACDIKGDVKSLSPMHFAPHLPFIKAVEIDTSNTCDELLKIVLCFSGDDMLFQINEMDALTATLVINAGDLKLDEEEMQLLISPTKPGLLKKWAGEDFVFNGKAGGEELTAYLKFLQETIIPLLK